MAFPNSIEEAQKAMINIMIERPAIAIVEQAGSYPSDKHYKSLIEEAKRNSAHRMDDDDNLEDISEQLRTAREQSASVAEEGAKELSRTIIRMKQRRDRLYKLEDRLYDMRLPVLRPPTAVEAMEKDRAMDNLVNRIDLERDNMERDEQFARKVTKKIAEELNGL